MSRTYRKYGFPLPEVKRLDITSDDATGVVADGDRERNVTPPTTNAGTPVSKVAATAQEGDSEFLSPITIGGQTLNMDFDTGSSDL